MERVTNTIEMYNTKSRRLPVLSKRVRLLLKLNSMTLIRRISFVKKGICRALNIPISTQFGPNFYCTSGKLVLDNNVSFADTFILDYAEVVIGRNVSFSYRNMIITSTHDYNDFSNIIVKPVRIGDNVWITSNVTILPGVTIGSNTIIGAGSVVSKDIPAGVFAAGNPCRVIKAIKFRSNG